MNNRYVLLGIIGMLLFVSGCSTEELYTIEGNSVLIDDENLYLKVTPHTIDSSGWVETEFISKLYTGDIDFVFGFDTETVSPTNSQIYSPHSWNETIPFTCNGEFNYTLNPNYFTCIDDLGSEFSHWFDSGNLGLQTAYWHQNYSSDWVDWNPDGSIYYNYSGMTKWYYSTERHVNENQLYKLRYYVDVPFNAKNGKYTLAIKPSSESIEEAILNEHFYLLDPWWNVSYKYEYPLNITLAVGTDGFANSEANHSIIVVNVSTMDGNLSSLAVVLNDETEYEWEWAFHGDDAPYVNDTIRFVANNFTFEDSTAYQNFSIYIPESFTSQKNTTIFYMAEDFEDNNSGGWTVDASSTMNITETNKMNGNYSMSFYNPHNDNDEAMFNFASTDLDDMQLYAGVLTYNEIPTAQGNYWKMGYQTGLTNMLGGLSYHTNDDFKVYNEAALTTLTESYEKESISLSIDLSGANAVYNSSARYGNNTLSNFADRGTVDAVDRFGILAAGVQTPFEIYWDDFYVGTHKFNLYYYTEYTIEVLAQQLEAATINEHAWTPTVATINTTGLRCLANATSASAGATNISFKIFKNDVYDNTYDTSSTGVVDETIVYTTPNISGQVISDKFTCMVNVTEGAQEVLANTSITITSVPPYFNETPQAWSDYHTANVSADFNCTDIDIGDTITYSITNTSGELLTPLTINSSDGRVNGDPLVNDTGIHLYNVTCSDGAVSTDQQFNVSVLNHIPVISSVNPSGDFFTSVTNNVFNCSATDTDSDALTYIFYNNSDTVQNSSTTSFTYGVPAGEKITTTCNVFDGFNYSGNTSANMSFGAWTQCTSGSHFNMTFKNEASLLDINSTLTLSDLYTVNGYGGFSHFYTNTTENGNYSFCFSPSETTTISNLTMTYGASGYESRTYQTVGTTLTNSTTSYILYLIETTQSGAGYVTLHIQDQGGNPITGATIIVERQFSGVWTQISSGTTDGSGSSTFFLNGNYEHRFTISHNDYPTKTTNLFPTSTDYTIQIGSAGSDIDYTNPLENVTWSYQPLYGNLLNNTAYNFNFTVNGTGVTSCQFNLTNSTGGVFTSVSGCAAGSDSINQSYTNTFPYLYGRMYIDGYTTGVVEWYILTENVTQSGTMKDAFDMMKVLFYSEVTNDTEAQISLFLFFMLFVIFFLGIITATTGWELRNEGGLLAILFGLTWMACYAGWFTLNLSMGVGNDTTDPAFFEQWLPTFLMGSIFVGWALEYWGRR